MLPDRRWRARSMRWKTLNCCGVEFVTVTVPSAFVTTVTGAAAVVVDVVVAVCPVVFFDAALAVDVVRSAPVRTPTDALALGVDVDPVLTAAVVAVVAGVVVVPVVAFVAGVRGCTAPTEAAVGVMFTAFVAGVGVETTAAGLRLAALLPAPT